MPIDPSSFVYHAWLASAALSSGLLRQILIEYQTPENFFHAFCSGNYNQDTISHSGSAILCRNKSDNWLKKTCELLLQYNIRAFTSNDEVYPQSLHQMDEPPAILFYQGDLRCINNRSLAMVGSRAASYNGQNAAQKIARELSSKGIVIISGMADGIDAFSHKGCIEGGSPTIAVTGCGLDIVYPSGNVMLRDKILKSGGLLLSEYAPGEKPIGWHFPYRNRIITGLAHALVVIEAKIRSGTMTSVQHALNQGKDIFVYPGDPSSAYSEGNHQLLREGAMYFTTAGDILDDLGWLDNHKIIRQNSVCSHRVLPTNPEEEAVVTALLPGSLSFEQIIDKSGLSPACLMSTLTMLQIKGLIEALPGKQYRLKPSGD